jgi:hypothetical protein
MVRLAPLVLLLWLPAAAPPAADPGAPARQGELVIVKEGTKEYHRPGCEVIRDGKGVLAMTRAQAEGRKLTPHEGCDPDKVKPDEPAAAPGKPGAKPSPKTMVVVDGGRHYHKDASCKRVGKETRKMTLDEAGRKLWPCPECKPPIRPRPR